MGAQKRTGLADWTDLQFLVELARHGSLSGTARALGVTHVTVARRIAALDAEFGRPLFRRQDGRYVPTTVGAQIVALATEMEEPALRIARAMAGVLPAIAGPVRITATDSVASNLVAPVIPALQTAQPGLDLELVISEENLSLARRDADIALRLGRPTQGDLFTRKIGDLAYYRFAAKSYLKGRDPADYRYIGYCNVPTEMPEVRTLESLCGDAAFAMRTNHLGARVAAVENSVGIGLLPKFLGDSRKRLQRLDRTPVLTRELWLIVHRDLRDVPRIRTCVDYLVKAFRGLRKQMG